MCILGKLFEKLSYTFLSNSDLLPGKRNGWGGRSNFCPLLSAQMKLLSGFWAWTSWAQFWWSMPLSLDYPLLSQFHHTVLLYRCDCIIFRFCSNAFSTIFSPFLHEHMQWLFAFSFHTKGTKGSIKLGASDGAKKSTCCWERACNIIMKKGTKMCWGDLRKCPPLVERFCLKVKHWKCMVWHV